MMSQKSFQLTAGNFNIEIRPFKNSDSLKELTKLLNRAYQQLADLGFRYTATYQDDKITAERIKEARCLVGLKADKIVATISYYPPETGGGVFWYEKAEVAKFGQFAVDPELQKSGIGSYLLQLVERIAKEDGSAELALDTAEGATHLINYYQKRGYRFVGYADWGTTNYRSVILSKRLHDQKN